MLQGGNDQSQQTLNQQSYQSNNYQTQQTQYATQPQPPPQPQQQQYSSTSSNQQYPQASNIGYQQTYQTAQTQQIASSNQPQGYYQTQPQSMPQPVQPQTAAYSTSQSYAAQGQQAVSYPGGQPGYVDQSSYNQTAGNPYRTMSPTGGRYPQPTQGYDYAPTKQPLPQNTQNRSVGYAGPGYQ